MWILMGMWKVSAIKIIGIRRIQLRIIHTQ